MIDQVEQHNLNWDKHAEGYNNRIQEQFNSFQRDAWLRVILERAPTKEKLNILDVGTGPGFFPLILGEKGHTVTGIDFSADMLRLARENMQSYHVPCTLRRMDASNLDFADESFDLVINRNITYALAEPEKAYREWLRVLRHGGKLLVFDANWFNFLFCAEENARMDAFLEEYHHTTSPIHDTYEEERDTFAEHIYSRPLSRVTRPNWDCRYLRELGAVQVKADLTVGQIVYTPEEQYRYIPTPLFAIEAVKPRNDRKKYTTYEALSIQEFCT